MQSQHGHLSVVQALILFLKTDNVFTPLIESGISSHIFRVKDTRLSLFIMNSEISLPFKNRRTSKILVVISKLKQRICNLRRDLVFSLINFSCKGL